MVSPAALARQANERRTEVPARRHSPFDRSGQGFGWRFIDVRGFSLGVMVVGLLGCRVSVPCAPDDVRVVLDECGLEPRASPSFDRCFAAGLQPPPSFSGVDAVVAACSREGLGAVYACMAARSSECRRGEADGGVTDADHDLALAASCAASQPFPGVGRAPSPAGCERACDDARRACAAACPTSSWVACEACGVDCAERSSTCLARC
ncbi:MAG: hypothetical protein INH41_28700 [Myxococcaceae bacterium]|jgi:hypothetical protein|nr:hypothetical protein [Myxococcaceae bacterium]